MPDIPFILVVAFSGFAEETKVRRASNRDDEAAPEMPASIHNRYKGE
jgi:hypothetical protein